MRVSVCVGEYSTIPYYIAGLEVPVYSMEELCFGLRENAFLLDISLMNDELVTWIDKECGLKSLAGELHSMIHKKGSLSMFVTLILEYVGLYGNSEIREVERVLKQGAGLSRLEKRKSQIDYMVKRKKFVAAIREYDELLSQWGGSASEPEEGSFGENSSGKASAGNSVGETVRAALLHNKAVALAGMMLYESSAECFLEAYRLDNDKFHYRAYLAAKRLQLPEKEYIAFAANQTGEYEQTLDLERKLETLEEEWRLQPEFQSILMLEQWRESGEVQRYYEEGDFLTQKLKDEYLNCAGE